MCRRARSIGVSRFVRPDEHTTLWRSKSQSTGFAPPNSFSRLSAVRFRLTRNYRCGSGVVVVVVVELGDGF